MAINTIIGTRRLRSLFWLVGVVFCLILGAGSAQASLTLDLGTIRNQDNATISNATLLSDLSGGSPNYYIDVYHTNPFGRDPRLTTGRVLIARNDATYTGNSGLGAPPTYVLDYAKYLGYVTSDSKLFFVRGASDSAPGGSIYVRVWSGTPNAADSYYSQAASFSNGALSPTSGTLNATTNYKAAKPYPPLINKFEETKTTVMPAASASATLKVYSVQPPATDGLREVTGYAWKMGTTADRLSSVTGATGSALELDSSSLVVGQTYYFQATHSNWFGGSDSLVTSYAVSGSGAGGGAGPVTYGLKKIPDGLGLTAVAVVHNVPFSVNTDPASSVGTIAQLVAAINAKSSRRDNVTAIGWMEDSALKGFYITYSSTGSATFTPTTGLTADGSLALERGRSYQISVNSDVSVTFSQ